MSLMFQGAKNFNRDLSRWTLREGANLSRMLYGAISMDSRRKPKMVVFKEAADAAESGEADEKDDFEYTAAPKGRKRR